MGANSDLAQRLFTATSGGDVEAVRAMCADGIEVRQNGGPAGDVEALVSLVQMVLRVSPDLRYEEAVCVDTDDGFVEEHVATGTLPDGSTFRIPACVVARVDAGLVTSLNEYLDPALAAPLMRAASG